MNLSSRVSPAFNLRYLVSRVIFVTLTSAGGFGVDFCFTVTYVEAYGPSTDFE